MSYPSTIYPNRRLKIVTLNLLTDDPIINPNTFWFDVIYQPNKPCRIVHIKTHLVLSNNMEINYDNSDPLNPTIFNGGNTIAFAIYRGRDLTTDNIFLPRVSNLDDFWPYAPENDLLDYGWMKVDKPPEWVTPIKTVDIDGYLGLTATIFGPITATGGVGTVGPLDVDGTLSSALTFDIPIPQAGGTTVLEHKKFGYINIQMTGRDDYIAFSGRYAYFDNVNTGGNLSGTIELLIEF